MTGRGEGYCAVAFPSPGTGKAPYGYAGLAGTPVQYPYRTPSVPAATFPAPRFGRGLGWRRSRGGGRRRW